MTPSNDSNLPVLVTGVAGFIGFHLARRLLDDGQAVLGIDNLNDYYDVSLKEARLALLRSKGMHGLSGRPWPTFGRIP